MSKGDIIFVRKEWAKHKRQQDYKTPTAECWITENRIFTTDKKYDYCGGRKEMNTIEINKIISDCSRDELNLIHKLINKEKDNRIEKGVWWKTILIRDLKFKESFRIIDSETKELIISARRKCDAVNYSQRLGLNLEDKTTELERGKKV